MKTIEIIHLIASICTIVGLVYSYFNLRSRQKKTDAIVNSIVVNKKNEAVFNNCVFNTVQNEEEIRNNYLKSIKINIKEDE